MHCASWENQALQTEEKGQGHTLFHALMPTFPWGMFGSQGFIGVLPTLVPTLQ